MEIDLRIRAITAIQQAWQKCHTSARLYVSQRSNSVASPRKILMPITS